jgi:multiple antibiotic resistance protein
MFDLKEIFTVGMILFAVIDIVGSIPVIISLKKSVGHIQSEKATIVAGFIMIAFLFLGEQILTLIGIDINSFAVAGSFIIFFISLEFPLIAGAGTLTSILTLRAEYDLLNIIVAIIVNMIVVYIVLKSSGFLEKFLGNSGLNVLRKIFGVVLMAIAVKIFSANIQNLF